MGAARFKGFCMHVPSLLTCLGLAVSASPLALAQPLAGAGRITDTRVERVPGHQPTPREGVDYIGELITMRAELENFPLGASFGGDGFSAPATSFTGPPGFQWPLNNLRGQGDGATGSAWVRIVDLSGDPVSGPNGVTNATRAIRIQTATAQAPGGFFTGANLRFGGQPGEPTQPLAPTADHAARVSAELYIGTIDQMFTFEPVSTFHGFIAGRLLWGGTNDDPSTIHSLGVQSGFGPPLFFPVRTCMDYNGFGYTPIPGCVPHPGSAVGDLVSPPITNWSRFAAETTADGKVRFLLDLLDGAGEHIMTEQPLIASSFIDRLGWNTSYELQDAFLLVDNIEASGPLFVLPKPPPLTCPYLDDAEWLRFGPLLGQTTRWAQGPHSGATVTNDGLRGQVISQINNIEPDNHYRRELSTELLPSSATLSNDLVATVQVRTTGGTVRGFALFDGADLAARVYFGREDPNDPDVFFYEPSIYAQINPSYEPIDEPDSPDPQDNVSVVGVDVADTKHDWQNNGQYRTLEMRLSANGVLRVSIDGQRIYAGAGAFMNSIDRFAFESENQAFGQGSQLRLNDVTLICDAPSCAADFNLDDIVDFADLNTVLTNFGILTIVPPQYFLGNTNGDDSIDFTDLNAVLTSFGTSCD